MRRTAELSGLAPQPLTDVVNDIAAELGAP
jgi:hypothetical protein